MRYRLQVSGAVYAFTFHATADEAIDAAARIVTVDRGAAREELAALRGFSVWAHPISVHITPYSETVAERVAIESANPHLRTPPFRTEDRIPG